MDATESSLCLFVNDQEKCVKSPLVLSELGCFPMLALKMLDGSLLQLGNDKE